MLEISLDYPEGGYGRGGQEVVRGSFVPPIGTTLYTSRGGFKVAAIRARAGSGLLNDDLTLVLADLDD